MISMFSPLGSKQKLVPAAKLPAKFEPPAKCKPARVIFILFERISIILIEV